MKICRIKASDISLDAPLSLDGQLQTFERRLTRLWQIGILPSRMAKAMGISLLQVSEELDRIDEKLGGLSLDGKSALEYGLSASNSARTRKTKLELELVDTDLLWLQSISDIIPRKKMAEYFGVQEESLSHHQRRNNVSMQKTSVDDRENRNKLVMDEYLQAVNSGEMRGIVTKLSNRHGVSRKMIDLILGEHKVIQVKKVTPATKPEIVKKHEQLVRAYNDRRPLAVSDNALIKELAIEFGYKSAKGVIKVIAAHNDK
ncbi:hypothetical protein LMH73_014690 [Vibrio splendidus]|nr:hypothetical protein [Vibrio splendidus]MCC4882921.1 hypothetical protein [Vibrio splendidus]